MHPKTRWLPRIAVGAWPRRPAGGREVGVEGGEVRVAAVVADGGDEGGRGVALGAGGGEIAAGEGLV
ncbi:MAG: hypothetical protein ABIO70_02360, partial [Pseudomonadota bacterium]